MNASQTILPLAVDVEQDVGAQDLDAPGVEAPELGERPALLPVWARVAVYVAGGLVALEALKDALVPSLAVWQSQALTIAVSSAVAGAASWWAIDRQRRLHRRVAGEAAERARLAEANRALTSHVAERRRVEAALRASEAELHALVAAMSDVILVLDRDGRHVKAAPDAARRLYAKTDDVLGRRLDELLPAEKAAELLAHVHRALEAGTPVEMEYAQEVGDRTLWFATTVSPMTDRTVLWVARDITARRAAEEALRHDAYHDALTGLPNRAYLTDLLTRALARAKRRFDRRFAVLFLDCDRFKVVNDSLGHAAGDELLRAVAERLTAAVRPGDVVARLGGDEFTVLLDDVSDADDTMRVAQRIHTALADPFTVVGRELYTSVSIGIALSAPDHASADDVLRDADLAMYQAKSRGRARHELFTPELRAGADRRLALESDLRRAVERGELRIYYQPIASLETGHISSFEALVRWEHPERGLVSPADFLPIAEETGLIVPIGRWMIEAACRQARAWQLAHPHHQPPVSVSVNVAAAQLTQPGLVEAVRGALAGSGLSPESLKLEVTEGIISADAAAAVGTLTELSRLGVLLLMDDFGTGHSSLSYLHRFPISTVKIDQYFVGRMDTIAECYEIVRTIVGLAHALDMDVVAEGVESPAQVEQLHALGCEYMQGYLLSKPVPYDVAAGFMGAPRPVRAAPEPRVWAPLLAARRV